MTQEAISSASGLVYNSKEAPRWTIREEIIDEMIVIMSRRASVLVRSANTVSMSAC